MQNNQQQKNWKLSSQIQTFMLEIKNSLAEVMVSLESDDVLAQMRNDPSLYEYKLAHMKEIIKEEFAFEDKLAETLTENAELKKKCVKLQESLTKISQEYAYQIENIDAKCQQYITEKQKERLKLSQEFQEQLNKHQLSSDKKCKHLNQQITKLQGNLQSTEEKLNRSEEKVEQLKSATKKLKEEMNSKIKIQQESTEKDIEQYEQIISKMQQDMLLIKTSWERKCAEVEHQTRQEQSIQFLKLQEKLKAEFLQNIENLKLGKNIVLGANDEVMNMRVEVMENHFKSQIDHLKEEIKKKDEEIHKLNLQNKKVLTQKEQSYHFIKENQKKTESNRLSYEKQTLKLTTQIEKLKSSENLLLGEIKKHRAQAEEDKHELRKVKEQINFYLKKQQKLQEEMQQFQQEKSTLKQKINQNAKSIHTLQLKIQQGRQLVNTKQESIVQLQRLMESMKSQLENNQHNNKKHLQSELALKKTIKQSQEKEKKISKKMDRLFLSFKKIQKQFQILKENIRYIGQIYKSKMASQLNSINDQLHIYKQSMDKRYRSKVTQLLDQIQGNTLKDKETIQNLLKERQNMKHELKEYEYVLDKKEEEHIRAKQETVYREVDRCKRTLGEEINKERETVSRLKYQLESNKTRYQANLTKAQKQIGKVLLTISDKWTRQLQKVQDQSFKKDKKIKELTQKLQAMCEEYEAVHRQTDLLQGQIKKQKSKYEQIKQERDEKVENLMRKFEQESKHKLNLQRQLKQMRALLLKSTSSGSVANFNSFSFTDRQSNGNRNNLQNIGTTNSKALNSYPSDRQKELSQIKEMIAKTYKVVGQNRSDIFPEKDFDKNKNRKTLFD